MSDMPETIWAWRFAESKRNEHMTGGWHDAPDPREKAYRRADLPATDAQALKNPNVMALVEAAKPFAQSADGRRSKDFRGMVCFTQCDLLAIRAALAAFEVNP